eukprot:scaffold437857_cov20-Prasinocladus_malaysianus.AAC.1
MRQEGFFFPEQTRLRLLGDAVILDLHKPRARKAVTNICRLQYLQMVWFLVRRQHHTEEFKSVCGTKIQ